MFPTFFLIYNMFIKYTFGPSLFQEKNVFCLHYFKTILIIFLILICFFQLTLDLMMNETIILIFILQKLIYVFDWGLILCILTNTEQNFTNLSFFVQKFLIIAFVNHFIFNIIEKQVILTFSIYFH